MSIGRLGAATISVPGSYVSVYTVPTTNPPTSATCNYMICNQSASNITVNVALSTGSTPQAADFLDYGVVINPGETLRRTGISASGGQSFLFTADNISVNCVITGTEIQQNVGGTGGFVLPIASATSLGGVKLDGLNGIKTVGSNLDIIAIKTGTGVSIDSNGFLNVVGGGGNLGVRDYDGNPSVNSVTSMVFPNGSVTDNGSGQVTISIQPATSTVVGGVKVSNGGLLIDANGLISINPGAGVSINSTTGVIDCGIKVTETDGSPSIDNVTEIKFPGGSVTDNGNGSVTVNTGGGATDPGMLLFYSSF